MVAAMLFSVLALSGHFTSANAQSGGYRFIGVKAFYKMSGYSAITGENANQHGGSVDINVSGNALNLCPGGAEKMRFTWRFEREVSQVSINSSVNANLNAGVLSRAEPCTGSTIASYSELTMNGSSGDSSPLSPEENREFDGERFVNRNSNRYVKAAVYQTNTIASLEVRSHAFNAQYSKAFFTVNIYTRAGDIIRYVYMFERTGSNGGAMPRGGLTQEQISAIKQWIGYYDNLINQWIQYRDRQVAPYWNDPTYYQWARNEYQRCNQFIQSYQQYKAYYQNMLR